MKQKTQIGEQSKKYEIVPDYKFIIGDVDESGCLVDKRYVYRIRATKDIVDKKGNIIAKCGDFGGYVQSEDNLSQEGCCWIYPDAVVYQDSKIQDAAIAGNKPNPDTKSFDPNNDDVNVIIKGKVLVCENGIVSGEQEIDGKKIIRRRNKPQRTHKGILKTRRALALALETLIPRRGSYYFNDHDLSSPHHDGRPIPQPTNNPDKNFGR